MTTNVKKGSTWSSIYNVKKLNKTIEQSSDSVGDSHSVDIENRPNKIEMSLLTFQNKMPTLFQCTIDVLF